MAHHLKVEIVPDKNMDGSPSKSKKLYKIYDRTRRGWVYRGQVRTKKELKPALADIRTDLIDEHLAKHPNDLAFRRKHGLR